MPFINHDSDKSKFQDRIFFQKISDKKQRIYRKIIGKIRKAFSKKSDLTIGPEFFI